MLSLLAEMNLLLCLQVEGLHLFTG